MLCPITFVKLVLLLGGDALKNFLCLSEEVVAQAAELLAKDLKVRAYKTLYDELRVYYPLYESHLNNINTLIRAICVERSNKQAAMFLKRFHKNLVKLY